MSRKSKSRKQAKKQRAKQQQRRERRHRAAREGGPSSSVLARAERLIGAGQWQGAREVLEESTRLRPDRPDALGKLLDVYEELGDFSAYCRTCARLLKLSPDKPELYLMYAEGLMQEGRIASALQAIHTFLERWPEHAFTEGAQADLARFESAFEELVRDAPFAPADRVELAALHEEALSAIGEGDFRRCLRAGEELHRRCPEFLPVMNNLSEAYFRTGKAEKAVETSRRVLQAEPQNVFALGNLTRHLFLLGRGDEAKAYADRLRELDTEELECYLKQAETFSYLGDDAAVLDAHARAERAGCLRDKSPDVAMLCHLAGVAAARQDDVKKAKALWRTALRANRELHLADENLNDLKRPVAERHGPFPFGLENWISRESVERLLEDVSSKGRRGDDRLSEKLLDRFLQRHPELLHLVPALLDRGDRLGREFAVRLAKYRQTPAMLEALQNFCQSKRGPDETRLETVSFLSSVGAMPPGEVRLWIRGQWQETEIFGFEVTDEPGDHGHSDEVNEWLADALDALRGGDGSTAEALLNKALEQEPDSPDLLNNLAVAYQLQGREREAFDLVEHVHARWPDYFFGRIAVANRAIQAGDLDKAQDLLSSLAKRRKLHTTEFTALCEASTRLYAAKEDWDALEKWLSMWREFSPDDPRVKKLEPYVSLMGAVSKIANWGRRRQRKR